MSQEKVQHVLSLLQAGVSPLFRLHVRKGNDSLNIRVVGTDNHRFQCVAADPDRKETFLLSHDSIKHGTFILEEIAETNH